MLTPRYMGRMAFVMAIALLSLANHAAKAQSNCDLLSGSQRVSCQNVARSLANKKAADAEKAKLAASRQSSAPSSTVSDSSSATATQYPTTLVPVAGQGAPAQSQTCKGLQVIMVSLNRTGPGDITANFLLRNTTNDDMATFVYYGGANNRNTFLVDETGTEWPKKRVDGNGNHRQSLIAGVSTKYPLIFHTSVGGQDAKSFQVVTWFQLLPLSGMGEIGWCNIKFSQVPVTASTDADQANVAPPTPTPAPTTYYHLASTPPPPTVVPAPAAPMKTGQLFRPDFHGTVTYSGTYTGKTGDKDNSGQVSITLDVHLLFGSPAVSGSYKATGYLGSGEFSGDRNGETCTFKNAYVVWTAQCGPDGLFAIIDSQPTVSRRPATRLTVDAPNVTYPSAIDQAGSRPQPVSVFASMHAEILKHDAEQNALIRKGELQKNELAVQAIRNKTDARKCLDKDFYFPTHTAYGPKPGTNGLSVGNYEVNDPPIDRITNSCGFDIDVTTRDGVVRVSGNFQILVKGGLDLTHAQPHLFTAAELK